MTNDTKHEPTVLLTLTETAERLRKSDNQLRWLMHQRRAPRSAKIGGRRMFIESDVEDFIRAQFALENSERTGTAA